MKKIRGLEVDNKFFYWLGLINFILLFITILQWDSKSGLSILWYLLAYPLWIGFFSILIALHFKIANRGWFLYFPVFIINYLVSYIMVLHQTILSMPENYIITLNDYLIGAGLVIVFFLGGLLSGGMLGFLASLFLTVPDRPPKYEIKKNIISFKLPSQSKDENNVLTRSIGIYICNDMNFFRFRSIDKKTTIYKSKKLFSLQYIFASANDNSISYFPFIKDGFKYLTNSDIIPFIKVIGNRIFGLKEISDDSLVTKFIDYTKLHKLLTSIRSIKGKRLNRNEKIGLFVLVIFVIAMCLIFVIPSHRLEFSFNLSLINILVTIASIAVGIIGTVSTIIMYRKLKKERKKAKS